MDFFPAYTEQGTGEPLLLLHGNGESKEYFDAQISAFAAHFRVIAVDSRGHGASPMGTAPFTLSQFADDLYAFLCHKGIRRAHILGFSDGGNVAVLFALRHPDMVDRLVLGGANLRFSGLVRSCRRWICRALRDARIRERRMGEDTKKEQLLLLLMRREPNLPLRALGGIPAPTLVLLGTKDLIRRSHGRQMARHLPCGTYAELAGGHAVARENPAAYNRRVLAFLLSE